MNIELRSASAGHLNAPSQNNIKVVCDRTPRKERNEHLGSSTLRIFLLDVCACARARALFSFRRHQSISILMTCSTGWQSDQRSVSPSVRTCIPAIPIPSISPGPTPHASRTTKPTWPTALPTGKCWNGLICGIGILRMFPESSVFFGSTCVICRADFLAMRFLTARGPTIGGRMCLSHMPRSQPLPHCKSFT